MANAQYYFERRNAQGNLEQIPDGEVTLYLDDEIRAGRIVEAGSQSSATIVRILRDLNIYELPHDHSRHGYIGHVIQLMKGRMKGAFQRYHRQRLVDAARARAAAAERETQAAREALQQQAIDEAVAAVQNRDEITQDEVGFNRITDWLVLANDDFMERIYLQFFACQGCWKRDTLHQ